MTKEERVYQIKEALKNGDAKKTNDLAVEVYNEYKNMMYIVQNRYKKVYARSKETKNDIEAEAKKAYWEAICTYDIKKGAFSTWLYHKLEYELMEWVRCNKIVRLPRNLQILVNKYNQIVYDYKVEHMGKQPSNKYILMELNKEVKVDEKRLKDIIMAQYSQNIVSLNNPADDSETVTMQDVIDRTDICECVENIEDKCIEEDMKNRIFRCMKLLKKEEYEIVYAVFFENKKQCELVKELGKPKQTINSILGRSLKKLSKMTEIKKIASSYGYSQKIV